MRYRQLDANGDMIFGRSGVDFYVNSPAAVAQAVQTRLLLFAGEYFLDTTAGTQWATRVLGRGTATTYDPTIRARILGTPGVKSITSYSSRISRRRVHVTCTLDTIYGAATVSAAVASTTPVIPPPQLKTSSAYIPVLVL